MNLLRKKAKISDEAALAALRAELCEIGARYRRIIETTPCDLVGSPFNKTLTQRGDWMTANVVNPAEKLLAALDDGNRAWFSTWPYENEFDEFPDRDKLRADLEAVLAYSSRLVRNLRGEQREEAATNQELRFTIFFEVYGAVRRHLPSLTPKQGVYAQLDDEKTKRRVDPFPEVMRHIYAEITGIDEQLVRLIQMCAKDPDWHL